MYSIRPGLIIGFHGCDESVVNRVISGQDTLKASRNKYDWLGNGIYFWDGSPARALEYARFLKNNPSRAKSPIITPAVLGAVISLGHCLDLFDYINRKISEVSYHVMKVSHLVSGFILPKNRNAGSNRDFAFERA